MCVYLFLSFVLTSQVCVFPATASSSLSHSFSLCVCVCVSGTICKKQRSKLESHGNSEQNRIQFSVRKLHPTSTSAYDDTNTHTHAHVGEAHAGRDFYCLKMSFICLAVGVEFILRLFVLQRTPLAIGPDLCSAFQPLLRHKPDKLDQISTRQVNFKPKFKCLFPSLPLSLLPPPSRC